MRRAPRTFLCHCPEFSTHDAGDSEIARGRWSLSKLGFVAIVGVEIPWPAISGVGNALREQRELGMAV